MTEAFQRHAAYKQVGCGPSPPVIYTAGQVLRTFEEALFVGICGCLDGDGS